MKAATDQGKLDEREQRYAIQRRRQLAVLVVLAAIILAASILLAGPRNIFLPNWWRIDLP